MILFEKDWVEKHPEAVIHHTTKNTSFIRYASLCKSMNVDNHSMVLALHNPALLEVDPHSTELTREEMLMVMEECNNNFWYYLREVIVVPSKSGNSKISYIANRGNIALFWLFFNHITTILIQIRQTGKSLSVSILLRYLLNIGCMNTYMCLITKDDALRAKTVTDIIDVEDELPFYLKLSGKGDIRNTEMLTVKALGNTIKGFIAQSSKKAANGLGRGMTSPFFWFDEAAFLRNINITLPAALSAGGAARDLAKLEDQPWGTLITTTAGKKDDADGKYIYTMLSASAIWTESFLDARDQTHLVEMIRANSPGGDCRVNCTFSHTQLGYTDKWLSTKLEEAEVSGEDADRDFFNVWTSGTGGSPLPVDAVETIKKSTTGPSYTEIDPAHNYVTRWYITEEAISRLHITTTVILSLDTSDAVGNDDIALYLIDTQTGKTLATGNYNETNLITFSEWLVSWIQRFDNLTVIIERRSSGVMIMDYLIRMLVQLGIDPYRRIFNWVVNDADDHRDRYLSISRNAHMRDPDLITPHRRLFGFATSGSGRTARKSLFGNTLLSAAKYIGDSTRDSTLINQILGLTIRNGRVDHGVNDKDDMVVAWLLAYWFITNGKNLQHYGIDPKKTLMYNTNISTGKGNVSIRESKRNMEYRNKLSETIVKLNESTNPIISKQLEVKILYLLNNITDRTTVSVDEFLSNLKDKKFINALTR